MESQPITVLFYLLIYDFDFIAKHYKDICTVQVWESEHFFAWQCLSMY